ncbi:unnamed protein product [Allacma fusca]|uniref:Uncharacterized protein n=1 Tax=Allacma fusca TaxID=39272 RepID=A0A8J2KD06_9HEXA|nr:unnamed protein product [Allacma fusca]
MIRRASSLVSTLCTVLILVYCVTGDDISNVKGFTNQTGISNSTSEIFQGRNKSFPDIPSPVREHKKHKTESEARACPYCSGTECTGVSGYVFEPMIIVKVFIALVLGSIVFFALLFFYKLWAFVDLPYETSVYYPPVSSSAYKPYGQARASSSPIVSLTKTILDALEKVY